MSITLQEVAQGILDKLKEDDPDLDLVTIAGFTDLGNQKYTVHLTNGDVINIRAKLPKEKVH